MAAALNRQAFFTAVRGKPFGGSLSQGQISGIESVLDACPPLLGTDALAYCLATAFHETARTMLPVKEYGGEAYYRRMYDPQGDRPAKAKELGNTSPGDGAKFAGRGYVQLTGRANYRRATGELQALGILDRTMDLTATPDMAMVPDVAAAIMFRGMAEGWFTGRKLSQYFGSGAAIPVGARAIINGTDKADLIAGYFRDFRAALLAARHSPGGITVAIPTPPVTSKPIGPLVTPAPRNSGIVAKPAPAPAPTVQTGSLGSWLASLFTKKAS
jgi:putative chitinase